MRKAITCGDLDKIMAELDNTKTGAYVEIVSPELSAPPIMEAIHNNL
jgi:indolepyruvate decarboxylase